MGTAAFVVRSINVEMKFTGKSLGMFYPGGEKVKLWPLIKERGEGGGPCFR